MSTRSRRYQEAAQDIDSTTTYDFDEAIRLVLDGATADFEESVECHVRLGIDPENPDQQIRGSLVLPDGTGRNVTVVVFARGEKVQEAEEAGADFVGHDELIKRVEEGWLQFDQAIATPDVMSDISKLGPILGPRGLMPNNKSGTVTFDVQDAVRKVKKGQVEVRNDNYGIIHLAIGTDSMKAESLRRNLVRLIIFLREECPPGLSEHGQYFKSITLTPSMGPPVPLDPAEARRVEFEN